jgi:hypothetical protein
MRYSDPSDHHHLFNKFRWFDIEEDRRARLSAEIGVVEANRLLNTSVDDLCEYYFKKYEIKVPQLHNDQITADQREKSIDVRDDWRRDIRNRGQPFHVPGTEIEIVIPFSGDADVFHIQPTTYTSAPPIAQLNGNTLVWKKQGTDLNAEQVREEFDRLISEIKRYLGWLGSDASGFNRQIKDFARAKIEDRRQKLLRNQNLVAGLGFPLKARPDAVRTYTAPEVRRRIEPVMPKASNAPYKPEPVLSDEDYEFILKTIENMTLVMERSPSAFNAIDEESLRSHFLVQLNGRFEGQATGETFNYQGKTDILIRVSGKNIFIAECKYWGGKKKLLETISQLLGYANWRDTKTAVIVFNRNKDFSNVVSTMAETVKEHPNFKKVIRQRSETSFQYTFAHKDDPNREMFLTVMAFDVPHSELPAA